MRAALVHRPGGTPVVGPWPDATPAPGRTLVRTTAAPVVPLDVLAASGTSYFGRPATPYVPGVQGVGVVVDSQVHATGTRVWCATSAGMAPGDGALAELCSVGDDDVVPLGTGGVADAALAALGLSAVAAWACLAWRAALVAGERVVVLGGGGAVGQASIGAARVLGAGSVVAVCRSEPAAARAREAGADEVLVGVPPAELTDALRDAAGGPVDVVLDPVFGAVAEAACAALGDHGRLVNLGGSGGDTARLSSAALRSRSISVLGHTNNALSARQRADALLAVADHAAAGRIAVAHRVVAIEDVGRAWDETAAGRAAPRWVVGFGGGGSGGAPTPAA